MYWQCDEKKWAEWTFVKENDGGRTATMFESFWMSLVKTSIISLEIFIKSSDDTQLGILNFSYLNIYIQF